MRTAVSARAGLSEHCLVLRDGHVVEAGPTARVLDHPQDAHTKAPRAAVPELPSAA